jgi:phosphoenolpyruvate synthase/pyruvate phosphate dikinase
LTVLVRWFSDIGLSDRPTVGGKGASLGELTQLGVAVPEGFVVTTAAFETALLAMDPQGTIRSQIGQLKSGDDLEAVTRVSENIRARFARADLPPKLIAAISEALASLAAPAHPVAVRSSATSEDSSEASFAGLQDTYLGVRGEEAVLRALCNCWGSLYSRESVSYRLRLSLLESQVAMGVVVQRMLDSRSSGVMFTRSPLTGDRSVIAIEACFGLGSALVGGEVTPDKFVVSKVTGEIVTRTVSLKTLRHALEDGGVRSEPLGAQQQQAPAVSDAEIFQLIEVARRVEQHYGCPQDIEWAIAPDAAGQQQVYLLQSRPETVWARRDSAPIAKPTARAYDHVLAALSNVRR